MLKSEYLKANDVKERKQLKRYITKKEISNIAKVRCGQLSLRGLKT